MRSRMRATLGRRERGQEGVAGREGTVAYNVPELDWVLTSRGVATRGAREACGSEGYRIVAGGSVQDDVANGGGIY